MLLVYERRVTFQSLQEFAIDRMNVQPIVTMFLRACNFSYLSSNSELILQTIFRTISLCLDDQQPCYCEPFVVFSVFNRSLFAIRLAAFSLL